MFGQAKNEGGGEEEDEDEANPEMDKILPDLVVSLQATDEFLCKRVMQRPEEDIQGTEYDEENMLRRLELFRENNTEDNTVLNFFDELESDILLLDVMDDEDLECVFYAITQKCGPPVGFGLSPEEEAELYRIEEEQRRLALEQEEINKRVLSILSLFGASFRF